MRGMNNATLNAISLNQLLAAGLLEELSYMMTEEAEQAVALEAELMLDAAAGVDLRARLIGFEVSK